MVKTAKAGPKKPLGKAPAANSKGPKKQPGGIQKRKAKQFNKNKNKNAKAPNQKQPKTSPQKIPVAVPAKKENSPGAKPKIPKFAGTASLSPNKAPKALANTKKSKDKKRKNIVKLVHTLTAEKKIGELQKLLPRLRGIVDKLKVQSKTEMTPTGKRKVRYLTSAIKKIESGNFDKGPQAVAKKTKAKPKSQIKGEVEAAGKVVKGKAKVQAKSEIKDEEDDSSEEEEMDDEDEDDEDEDGSEDQDDEDGGEGQEDDSDDSEEAL